MATMAQIRQGLGQVWENIVEGWRSLTGKAAGAITRFTLPGRAKEEGSGDELAEYGLRNVGWGVLAAEVCEHGDRIVVRLEAPGMKRSDFDIRIVDDILLVRGEKRIDRESTQGRYHVVECAYGSFERAIPLPAAVDEKRARARYRKGVLYVELPLWKDRDDLVRRIPIS